MNVRADRFPLFDSLRAVAALGIFATHAAFFAGAYGPGTALGPYFARMDAGVAVFFVISGFLLYRPFARARVLNEPAPPAGPYAWRRFLRIAPAYWVALTAAVVLLDVPGVWTADGLPTFYALGQGYRTETIGGGLTPAWSLTVEVAFYAFLPLWAALMRRVPGRDEGARLRTEALALTALLVAAVLYKLAILAGDREVVTVAPALIALPAYLDHFALGMGLAVASLWLERRPSLPAALRPVDRFPSLCWLAAAGAFVLVAVGIGLPRELGQPFGPRPYFERHLLYGVIGFALVLPAVIGDQRRGLVRRVLANRALLWIGIVSYGIFLWNTIVLGLLDRWGWGGVDIVHPYVTWAAAGLAGTVVAAAASYYLVERPALGLKRLFGPPSEPQPSEATAEPAPGRPPRPGAATGHEAVSR